MSKTFRKWDEYVEEAKIEPFELGISDDETLIFEAPTGAALIQIMRGLRNGDLEVILANLAGDQWERLLELFGGVGHKAMPALTEDLMDHFELYEPVTLVGPGGGKVTRKRPTDIKRMLDQGYRPVGGSLSLARLVDEVDRYGEAIEYDLHVHYRLDLLDFFRGCHSWRKLRNLLDRLPVNSAYREAMLDDPEVAEVLAKQPQADGPPRPPGLQEFTPVVAALADVRDLLQLVHSDLLASSGVKPPAFKPAPRPVTGVQRARARLERARHDALVDEVKAAQERWRARHEIKPD